MKKLAIVVVAYLLYAATCFIMEDLARKKFHVISKADIDAQPNHRAQVRAAASQNLQQSKMTSWWPYDAYLILFGVVTIGGTLAGTALAIKPIWRSVKSYRLTAIGILMTMTLLLMTLMAPWRLADVYCESQRTPWTTDTLQAPPK
jgi:hypothetical protein